jgi:hypothetical protein
MSRGWVVAGLVVVVAMCLVPPRKVTVRDSYAAAADEMIEMEGVPDTDLPGEYRSTQIVYRPAWLELPGELGPGQQVQSVRLATPRLLLQIVGAIVLIGGLAFLGPTEWKTAASVSEENS